jgi:hypothetical protein
MGSAKAVRKIQVEGYVFEISHLPGDEKYDVRVLNTKGKELNIKPEYDRDKDAEYFILKGARRRCIVVPMNDLIGCFEGLLGLNGAPAPTIDFGGEQLATG